MSNISELVAVKMPARVAKRPKDKRGFPIPHSVQLDPVGKDAEGNMIFEPDFRTVSSAMRDMEVRGRLCAICGEKLEYWIYFIGGPRSIKNRKFYDSAMHKDCAEYALRVCPFLAISKYQYATHLMEQSGIDESKLKKLQEKISDSEGKSEEEKIRELSEDVNFTVVHNTIATVSTEKPDYLALARTRDYREKFVKLRPQAPNSEGEWLLESSPFLEIEWWKDGKPVEDAEVIERLNKLVE